MNKHQPSAFVTYTGHGNSVKFPYQLSPEQLQLTWNDYYIWQSLYAVKQIRTPGITDTQLMEAVAQAKAWVNGSDSALQTGHVAALVKTAEHILELVNEKRA